MKKMQRGGLTATNRKTAMKALGIKPKSKEFDPSTFGDKANAGNSRKKYAQGGSQLGPVYSGPTGGRASAGTSGPQKQPTRITGKMKNGGTKKMQKGGNVLGENKWIGELNQYLQKGVLQDIRNLYTPSKKTVAKNATKGAIKSGVKKMANIKKSTTKKA
jgi:hypothetical protein